MGNSATKGETVVKGKGGHSSSKSGEGNKQRGGESDEFDEKTVVPLPEVTVKPFINGMPTVKGQVTPCFDTGLLFKIETENSWAFYNDTNEYEMHVVFSFGANSKMKALGDTIINMDEASGEWIAETICRPLQTVMYISGEVSTFHSRIRAVPLSIECLTQGIEESYKNSAKDAEEMEKKIPKDSSLTTEEQILSYCIAHHVKFIDKNFPPIATSIQPQGTEVLRPTAWARPETFLGKKLLPHVRLFRQPASPVRIKQGDLGNNWVMCAIAILAESKSELKTVFRHPTDPVLTIQEQDAGAYRVSLNISGWWKSVIIDNYLPVITKKVCYGRCKDDPCEMWVSVLEKAYAKANGSYAAMLSGDPLMALQDFTGFPASRYDEGYLQDAMKGERSLFTRLERYYRYGFRVVLNTPNLEYSEDPREEIYAQAGLRMGNAYTVLRIIHMPDSSRSMAQIRNPWSSADAWTGDWGWNDPKWKEMPEVAEACDYRGNDLSKACPKDCAIPYNESSFWMDWEDVLRYFNGCGVLFSHPNYVDYRVKGIFNESIPTTCLHMTVTKKVRVVFMLSLERRNPGVNEEGNEEEPEYPPIMLSVCNASGSTDTYRILYNSNLDIDHPTSQFTFMQSRDVGLMCKLTPQESPYLIVPRIMHDQSKTNYVITVLTETVMDFKDAKAGFVSLPPTCQVFKNYPSFNGSTATTTKEKFQMKLPGGYFPSEFEGEDLSDGLAILLNNQQQGEEPPKVEAKKEDTKKSSRKNLTEKDKKSLKKSSKGADKGSQRSLTGMERRDSVKMDPKGRRGSQRSLTGMERRDSVKMDPKGRRGSTRSLTGVERRDSVKMDPNGRRGSIRSFTSVERRDSVKMDPNGRRGSIRSFTSVERRDSLKVIKNGKKGSQKSLTGGEGKARKEEKAHRSSKKPAKEPVKAERIDPELERSVEGLMSMGRAPSAKYIEA